MVGIEPLDASMFSEIYASFLAEDDPLLPEVHWRRLFQPADLQDTRPPGYCLVKGSRIVGLLGTLWSQRTHDTGMALVCNLHSWIVTAAYRGRSLLLMRPLLAQDNITITDFSPTPDVFRLSLRLGMTALDGRLRVLLPMPCGRRCAELELIDDPGLVEAAISDDDRRILRSHQLPWCRHALLRAPEGECYMLWSSVERWAVPYAYVHYVSNRQLFARCSRFIRARLLDGSPCRFLALDRRATDGMALPGSVTLPWGPRQLYRSSRLGPADIDTLYSEVSYLNLSTMPSLRA